MHPEKKIIIGTRGSALALVQAAIVEAALKTIDPTLAIKTRIIQTQGDINQQPIPLDTVGKGWFTKEIEHALSTGEIDLAVHSLKDMSEEMPSGLTIGAYLEREDARDVLITKNGESLNEVKQGAIVGTDSIRRGVQIRALRPDVQVKSVRGNVPTRLEKLMSEDYDAIILAAAGLKRLDLESHITRYFEPEEMTPSPGQGILAIQSRENEAALQTILEKINAPEVAQVARIERSFSRAIGGGCKSPTGAYAVRKGDKCHIIGMIANSAEQILRAEMEDPWDMSDALGEQLAHRLLNGHNA